MKLKFRKKHAHRLSKFDMFAGRYIEHDYNDEGQYHPTQMYPYNILNGKIKNTVLSKYHLIKKFGEKKKELLNYTKTKNTKQLKQLIRIHYFLTLAKKTYHLIKALKKAKKALKIWIRQMVQNEVYFFKRALQLVKKKEQLSLIYLKYKIVVRTYKKIYIKYIKNIIKRYLKKTKKIKKEWKKVLVHGFTKGLKQKNNIMPLIFYLRKILFKKIRSGTFKEMKYWKKLIIKFTKRHKIMKEVDLNTLINTISNKEQAITYTDLSLKPYILLNYVNLLKKKSRPVISEKIKKDYYQYIINLIRKRTKKRKLKLKKKQKKYKKLATFYALVCNKKKYIQRNSYKQRRLATYINKLMQKQIVKLPITVLKKQIENKLTLYKTISSWLITMKNWKRFKLFQKLSKLVEKKNVKKTKRIRKRKRVPYHLRKIMKKLKKRKNNIKIQILKKSFKRTNRLKKIFKFKKKKKIKARKGRWFYRKKVRRKWRKKLLRIAYKTPYILTCQLYRDYTGNWIELYKKKNMYNSQNKNKVTDQMTSKLMSKRQKRIIRKNYRHLLNDKYTMTIRHKEILLTLNRYFTPIM